MSGPGHARIAREGAAPRRSLPGEPPRATREHPVLGLQRAAGNRATAAAIQRKCAACGDEERVQRQIETEEPARETEETAVQRKCACGGSCDKCKGHESAAPDVLRQELDAPGAPLERETRSKMEEGFGQNFGDVRVHTGGHAARSAEAIGAQAYTSGRDIVFGAGRFAPETPEGRTLLAHELTHVLQQRGARPERPPGAAPVNVQPKLTISQPDDPFEREADQIAERVVERIESGAAVETGAGTAPAVQRQCDECKIAPPSAEEVEEDKEEASAEPAEVKRKADPVSTKPPDPLSGFQQALGRSRGGGRPLPRQVRRQMEEGFGQDFSGVRIHTGGQAHSLNRLIHAKAFTHGSSIYFSEGRYRPDTEAGRRLLAHELTHVVQQLGSRAIHPNIQREVAEDKIGNWAHDWIQERLRKKDSALITEAAIAGGTRKTKDKINVVGFADLYKSKGSVVAGVSAQEPDDSKILEPAYKFYRYVNMRKDWRAKAKSKGQIQFGPKITNKKWGFNPTFPSEIQIGEIKPLFPAEFPDTIAHYGLGFQQTRNYIEGYDNFLKRVRKDNPQHASDIPASSGGTLMDLGNTLPASLDYAQFETEHTTFGADAIKKKNTDQRLWVYKLEGGVYVYFLLPLEYKSKEYPAKVEEQLKKLDPLLAELRKKRPNMSGAFPKREQGPPPPRRAAAPEIQTKQEDWKKQHEAWEANRRKWVTGTGVEKPKKFLKEQAKAVEKRAKVDEKLKRTPSKQTEQEYKAVKSIRFWSSLRGRVLGALRFRFGHVFDKVEELFEKIKKKFKHHHQKADALKKTGGRFGGWKKVAADAIIRFGVDILKEMIVYAFKGFVACMNGIVDAIAGKYTSVVDEAKEELVKEIEPVCCEVMDFKKKLEAEYEKHEKSIAQFTETVEEINQWRQIFDDVELAVRIGVQIVSCGAPPGLGCLWGLVAQLGISAGLNLLMRTDYFEEEIAKPAARALMDAIVGDAFHNFLIEKLEETPLAPYLKEAAACQKRTSVVGGSTKIGNPGKLDPNDPKIAKIREEWEKQYQDEILRDLQTVFQKGKGKKPTKEDLEKLVEELKKLKKTPEELRAMFDAARDPASARIDVEKAQAVLAKGEVPKQEEKERKIDYDKAKRSNDKYEKIIGWDPARIAKKPGIKADSKEFADTVYDMQEALKLPKKDGILGPDTVKEYYERNGLKKDFVYESAVKVAEKAKQEKEAAEKGEGGEAPSFNLINGPDWVIKDQEKSQNIPKSVRVYISNPDYREMVKVPKPGDRELVFTPETVTLDIYVHDSLLYRAQNVAVGSLKIYRTVASIGGASGIWSLELTLKHGLEISPVVYPSENLILRRYEWSLDSMEKQAPEQKLP